MSGPWEQYQTPTAAPAQADGPWTQYAQAAPTPAASVANAPTDDSAMNGIALGMAKPFENIARAAQSILPASWKAASDAQDARLGSQTPDQLIAGNDAARANNSRTGYQTLGKVIGTAPTLALPGSGLGGLLLQGGAGGLLTSNAKDAGGAGIDGLIGAGAGAITGGLFKGAAAAITPKVAPIINYLQQQGVPLSLGRILAGGKNIIGADGEVLGANGPNVGSEGGGFLGRGFKAMEDKLAGTFPIAGGAINDAWQASKDGLNRAIANHVIKPLGLELPSDVAAGHPAVAYVKKAFNNTYDGILEQMQTHIDGPLQAAVTDLKQRAAELPGDLSGTFQGIYDRLVGSHVTADAPTIAGRGVKDVASDLRKEAKSYSSPKSTSTEGKLGDLISELRQSFLGAASRNSAPGLGKALADTDNAYGNFVVMRNGAKNSTDGMMTPGQLQTAVRVSDQSVGKGATATGTARMQDLSRAASAVLPSKVGDSGTAARNTLGTLLGVGGTLGGALGHGIDGAAVGAGLPLAMGGLLSLPYTKVGQAAARGMFSAPGPWRAGIANGLGRIGSLAPSVIPPLLARPQ